jgi:hypothetical protein
MSIHFHYFGVLPKYQLDLIAHLAWKICHGARENTLLKKKKEKFVIFTIHNPTPEGIGY